MIGFAGREPAKALRFQSAYSRSRPSSKRPRTYSGGLGTGSVTAAPPVTSRWQPPRRAQGRWRPPLVGAHFTLLFWWVALCAPLAAAVPPLLRPQGVAVLARADVSRTRRSFSRLENSDEVPNLIDVQRRSFEWL